MMEKRVERIDAVTLTSRYNWGPMLLSHTSLAFPCEYHAFQCDRVFRHSHQPSKSSKMIGSWDNTCGSDCRAVNHPFCSFQYAIACLNGMEAVWHFEHTILSSDVDTWPFAGDALWSGVHRYYAWSEFHLTRKKRSSVLCLGRERRPMKRHRMNVHHLLQHIHPSH